MMAHKFDEDALADTYERYQKDPAFRHLRINRNPFVPGEGGVPLAFIVGEAPGATEAIRRRPFVGRSGILLRRLMEQAGLFSADHVLDGRAVEANCWLTNVVKYRPPSNRTPYPDEIKASRIHLYNEWRSVGKPDVIVCAGATAYRAIMNKQQGIAQRAGTPSKPGVAWVWPMFHPAYGLRNESIRPDMEQHWRALGKWLKDGEYRNERDSEE